MTDVADNKDRVVQEASERAREAGVKQRVTDNEGNRSDIDGVNSGGIAGLAGAYPQVEKGFD